MILVDINAKVLIPVNDGIFQISQFKNEKKLNLMHKGCFILYSDGSIKEIESIIINDFYGKWFWEKIFSILNSTHSISVQLKPIQIDIETLKVQLCEYLQSDASKPDPYMPQDQGLELALNRIKKASDTVEIYAAFEVPNESDCLDVL